MFVTLQSRCIDLGQHLLPSCWSVSFKSIKAWLNCFYFCIISQSLSVTVQNIKDTNSVTSSDQTFFSQGKKAFVCAMCHAFSFSHTHKHTPKEGNTWREEATLMYRKINTSLLSWPYLLPHYITVISRFLYGILDQAQLHTCRVWWTSHTGGSLENNQTCVSSMWPVKGSHGTE